MTDMMDTKELKSYIKNLYELETSLYCQHLFYQKITGKMNEKIKYTESDTVSGTFLGIGLPGGMFGAFTGFLSGNDWYEKIIFMKYGLVFGILVGIFLAALILVCLSAARMAGKWRYYYRRYRIKRGCNRIRRLLDRAYSEGRISRRYRNLAAVSTFYEYLQDGRCGRLDGAGGACDLYENALALGLAASDVREAEKHLERTRKHQVMLYTAIKQSREKTGAVCSAKG